MRHFWGGFKGGHMAKWPYFRGLILLLTFHVAFFMKKIVFTLFVFLPLAIWAQFANVEKTFPLSTTGFDAGRQIIAVPDGSAYVVLGERVEAANANRRDVFVQRINPAGTQTAIGTFGNMNATETPGQALVPTWNGWMFVGTRFAADNSNSVGLLVRTRLSGSNITAVFAKEISIPNTTLVSLNDLDSLPDNGFIATGSATVGTERRIIAVKFAANGDVEWSQIYTAGTGRGIFVSSGAGNAFITGGNKLLRIRTSTGSVVWERSLTPTAFGPANGTTTVEFNDLAPMTGKQIAVLGRITNNANPGATSAYQVAVWTQGGDFKWQKTYHQGPWNAANPNEGTAVQYHGSSARLIITGIANKKVTVSHLSSTGTVQQTFTLGTAGEHFAPSLVLYNGLYAITAGVAAPNAPTNVNTFFFRTYSNYLGLAGPGGGDVQARDNGSETPVLARGTLSLGNNPVRDRAVLFLESPVDRTDLPMLMYDQQGKVVLTRQESCAKGYNRFEWEVGHLPPGIYWVNVPGIGSKALIKE